MVEHLTEKLADRLSKFADRDKPGEHAGGRSLADIKLAHYKVDLDSIVDPYPHTRLARPPQCISSALFWKPVH